MADALAGLAVRLATRAADTVVGWRAGAAVTAAALIGRAGAWAALLRNDAGRHYALYLDDSLEFAAALLGAWQAGKTVWLPADTLPATCAALRDRVDGFLGAFPADCRPLLAADPADGPPVMLDPEADALVVFTSGSTGAPQAVPKKLRQLADEVATLERVFGGISGGADVVATVSHQHVYGLLFRVLWPLHAGRPILAERVVYPEALPAALARRPCVLVASPALLTRLPADLDWSGARAMVRAVFTSGGMLPEAPAEACAGILGVAPCDVYGSSETGGIAWRGAGRDEAWTPLPGVAWRIADGMLAVRSPHLPDDGWFALADRAVDGGAGRFILHGRGDRIVKIEEKRVSLDALEAALLASGLAREARIVECPSRPGMRAMLAAFVVPTDAGAALLKGEGKRALDLRLRGVLAAIAEPVALPRRWRYPPELPRDAQGKITVARLLASLTS